MADAIFYGLAALSLVSALMAVSLRNLFHCALFWVLAMFGVAGVFLYLNAEFLAAVQVIIYVGAVTVFIFFGIMFTRNVMDDRIRVMNRQFVLAVLAAAGFGWLGMKAVAVSPFHGSEHPLVLMQRPSADGRGGTATVATTVGAVDASAQVDVEALARELLSPGDGYDYPFELVSILLLSALVGAIVVARKEPS
ncbi:MAG TPA: NADH-quinone oxidoreductase subunit J [bacterium]|nr:NADH-quinone oxidoreductase subunit J [bacterium]